MCKVSVIMPSLNVGLYIGESIASVLCQTIKDIEIICVDAGSTDGTLEILESYVAEDKRIRLIHSDRKSYGYQMNLGISEAAGEYIGILETDDYIEPYMYETLYDMAVSQEADISKADFDLFTETETGERIFVPYSLARLNRVEYEKLYSCEDYIDERIKPECYIWNAIYRRGFLHENSVRFNETPGASFQDFSFRYMTAFFAKRIVAVKRVCYHYRRDNSEASTYHPKTVEYNLRESKYTLAQFRDRQVTDKRLYRALANEIAEFAFWPYMELLKWGEPAASTAAAYESYRSLFVELIDMGYAAKEGMNPDLWKDVRLLSEGTDVYLGYARVTAEIEREDVLRYLDYVEDKDSVVIFGAGIRGNAIYALLRNNGEDNIKAFCDNDTAKVGTMRYGTEVIAPDEAVEKYRKALYIISSPSMYEQARSQLYAHGIPDKQIAAYPLSVHPLFCTNRMVIRNR